MVSGDKAALIRNDALSNKMAKPIEVGLNLALDREIVSFSDQKPTFDFRTDSHNQLQIGLDKSPLRGTLSRMLRPIKVHGRRPPSPPD